MISSRSKRGLGAAAAAASIALLFATLPATSAFADPSENDVLTNTVRWSGIDEQSGEISEAESLSDWTGDAFDGFGSLNVTNHATSETQKFYAADSPPRVEIDGVTTFDFEETIPWLDETTSVVTLRLTIEGSFARWQFVVTSGPAVELEFSGNVGADSNVRYTSAGSGIVSDDGANGPDPVLGFSVATSGTFHGWTNNHEDPDGGDQLRARVTGADLTAIVVYGDYTPCGFDEARSFIESVTLDLARVFGTAYGPIGTCLSVPDQTVNVGTAVDQRIPFSFVDGFDSSLFTDSPDVQATVSGVPAGLTAAVDFDEDNLPFLHLSGTATTTGTSNANITFTGVGRNNPTRAAAPSAPIASSEVLPGTLTTVAVINVATSSHTVTFDSNGGSGTQPLSADHGATVVAPAAPTRAGYTFVGWFAPEATTAFDFATPLTANVTLTAKWLAIPENTTASQTVRPGAPITVFGTDFIPGQTVEVWLHSKPVKLGTLTVASDGTVTGTFSLPSGTPAGQHHIVFVDEAGVEHRSGVITVPASTSASLAATGAEPQLPFAAALVLLLAGAGALCIRAMRARAE